MCYNVGASWRGPELFMDTIVVALAFLAVIGLVQLVLSYYMMRELGDIDGTRKDWWEKLADSWEPAKKLDESVRSLQGRPRKD